MRNYFCYGKCNKNIPNKLFLTPGLLTVFVCPLCKVMVGISCMMQGESPRTLYEIFALRQGWYANDISEVMPTNSAEEMLRIMLWVIDPDPQLRTHVQVVFVNNPEEGATNDDELTS